MKDITINDRRKDIRIIEHLQTHVSFINPSTNKKIKLKAETRNISDTGISLYTKESLDGIERVSIELSLPKPSKTIKFEDAGITWRDDRKHWYGIDLKKYNNQSAELLKEYLNRSTETIKVLIDRRRSMTDRRKQYAPLNHEDRRMIKYRRVKIPHLETSLLFPSYRQEDYQKEHIDKRREWISNKTGMDLSIFDTFIEEPTNLMQNVENLIGMCQIPLGIVGPIQVNGRYANGMFYVPFATTQGTLIESYQRGCLVASAAGGVTVSVYKDEIHISPLFVLKDTHQGPNFVSWLQENFESIKNEAESTTSHGKLLKLVPFIIGRRVIVSFVYSTGDAMGLNMINIATDKACKMISTKYEIERYYLRSNFSSDKKFNFYNYISSYGKEVTAELILPKGVIRRFLHTTPEQLYDLWYSDLLASLQGGMVGLNCHFANGLAAIFMACGQDIAQVVNASVSSLFMETTEDKSLRMYARFPELVVATVGGGTSLAPQKKCLDIIGCHGSGRVKKFAEIVAAVLLAGEISIMGALSSGQFAEADIELRGRLYRAKEKTK